MAQTTQSDRARPFTTAEALAAGWSEKRLHSSQYKRLFRGVYAVASVPETPVLRAKAALLLAPPGSHVSHLTAARVWGVPVPKCVEEHVSVQHPKDRRHTDGIIFHQVHDAAVTEHQGIRLTNPVQTFVDLAQVLGLVDLVVVGDHLVFEEMATREVLLDCSAKWSGRGAPLARKAARLVRERVESPMETRLRLLMVFAGLPEFDVNLTVECSDGRRRRLDLSCAAAKLAVEYDGRHHIERQPQWENDLRRRERLEQDGWRIIVVTAKDIYRTPGELLERIHAAALANKVPQVPRTLRNDWRRHFPDGH